MSSMALCAAINQTAFTDSPPGKQLIGKEKGARPQKSKLQQKIRCNGTIEMRKKGEGERKGNKGTLIKNPKCKKCNAIVKRAEELNYGIFFMIFFHRP